MSFPGFNVDFVSDFFGGGGSRRGGGPAGPIGGIPGTETGSSDTFTDVGSGAVVGDPTSQDRGALPPPSQVGPPIQFAPDPKPSAVGETSAGGAFTFADLEGNIVTVGSELGVAVAGAFLAQREAQRQLAAAQAEADQLAGVFAGFEIPVGETGPLPPGMAGPPAIAGLSNESALALGYVPPGVSLEEVCRAQRRFNLRLIDPRSCR